MKKETFTTLMIETPLKKRENYHHGYLGDLIQNMVRYTLS
jgi:hypothetical protein